MSSTADIDQTVANMVLARVALTTGDYTTAANAAGAVISAGYSLMNEEQYTTSGFQSITRCGSIRREGRLQESKEMLT